MRTSEEIRAEIEQTFGFFPPFFEPALASAQVLENLWQQTLSAYIKNPLSPLFKEKLNALLSRFCAVPYCMIVHSAALRPLGVTAQQILELLDTPFADIQGESSSLGTISVPSPEQAADPPFYSPLERLLLRCATAVFTEQADAEACHRELRRLLGNGLYLHLIAYLAYIKTCHTWIEVHPTISYQADHRAQNHLGPLLLEEPALGNFFRDYWQKIGAQHLGRQERKMTKEALYRAQADTHRLLESITDSFFALDTEWRFTYLNDQAEELLQRTRADLLGKNVWDEFPAAVGSSFEREYRRAATEQQAVSFEEYYPPPLDTWFEVRAFPSSEGLSVFFQNVTARKRVAEALRESEERYHLLVEGARDYAMILLDTEGQVTSWNTGAERILGWSEAEMVGQPADRFFTPEDCAAGIPVQELGKAAKEGRAMDLRWHLKKDASRFFADGIMESLRTEEGQLRGYAKVLRDATERKALEDERERLADANRLLLDSTGDGIYGIDPQGRFAFVNRAAAQMLGCTQEEMLGQNGHRLIHHSRPDGSSYPEDECPIYQALRTGTSVRVEDDVFWRGDSTSFAVAYTAAPILNQGAPDGAVVTFSDISERKALETERERLAERERNIATQLQAALTPSIPEHIPGMALAKYYEAALGEAGVGGDFYDVFPVDKGCTALVVGDLSGKGLAAASQVATVRNMLRYALYRAQTLSDALASLNALLVEQSLLTGFATLFVGTFESSHGTLTYVNAGQEPALVLRNSGVVELLLPTGPVLGAFEGSTFAEKTVSLEPKEALAIFTDGMTEIGATRATMLEIEGMIDLLTHAFIPAEAESSKSIADALALYLVQGVDAAAQGGVMRDDVCLLVGVMEE